MAINLNPNRINTSPGTAGKAARHRPEGGQPQGAPARVPRAHVNIVPSPESLATLIRSAVAALRQGVRWDRGSILNLLV